MKRNTGIKLIGLYVINQGMPAFVQGCFYVRHSRNAAEMEAAH